MKYRVSISVDAITHVEVEAASAWKASEKAFQEARVGVCHQCAGSLEVRKLVELLDVTPLSGAAGDAA